MPISIEQANYNEDLKAFDFDDFLKLELPKPELLLSPWLPAKGLAMVFAQRGIGKTHLCLGIAYAVATGQNFLDWSAPKARPVLLLDGEMPAASLQERMAGISARSVVKPNSHQLRLLPYDFFELGGPDLATSRGQEMLEPIIADAALIVVDNISTICRAGKENEAESWTAIQSWALAQRRRGRSVLFVHHAGKGGDQRGTSAREDVMDTVIKLSRPDDYTSSQGARFIVEYTKTRGFSGEDAAPFEAAFGEEGWCVRPIQNDRDLKIIEMAAEGRSQRAIASSIGCGVATVNRVLNVYRKS